MDDARWLDLVEAIACPPGSGEESFIGRAKAVLANSWKVDVWHELQRTAQGVSATEGLRYQNRDRIVPLASPTPSQPVSLFLMAAGLKRAERRSSNFIGLANRITALGDGVVATSCYSMVSVVVHGEFVYREYRLSERAPEHITRKDVFDTLYLKESHLRRAGVGDIVVRDRLNSIIVPDEQDSHAILLSAANHQFSSAFQYSFHESTGRLKNIADYDAKTSRRLKTIRIVERYGDKGSIPALERQLGDDHHMIRWSSIRGMLNLDPANAMTYLGLGAEDGNDEIRDLSKRLMRKFGEVPA